MTIFINQLMNNIRKTEYYSASISNELRKSGGYQYFLEPDSDYTALLIMWLINIRDKK